MARKLETWSHRRGSSLRVFFCFISLEIFSVYLSSCPWGRKSQKVIGGLWSLLDWVEWAYRGSASDWGTPILPSLPGLKKIACRVWRQVTPEYIHTLYESMPRCMAAVIEAEGGHMKYWIPWLAIWAPILSINELHCEVYEYFLPR